MEWMIVFWLFMTFLFGAMMLGLFLGFRSTEESRAREQQEREAQEVLAAHAMAAMPRFFATLDAKQPGSSPRVVFDDALLADVESYVRAEQTLVKQFVNDPSVDALYRQTSSSPIVN